MNSISRRFHRLGVSESGRRRRSGTWKGSGEEGVALVITLLLLGLISLLALLMLLSVNSDMLINGYYRNYRGSFYAADSGLNIARQQLVNQVLAAVPSTFTTPPIPSGTAATAQSYILSTYSSSTSLNSGQAASSWAGSFNITNASFSLAPSSPTVTATDPISGQPTAYQYIYNYSLTSVGAARGTEQATVSENGSIIITVSGTAAASGMSFAAYGAFVDQYPPCLGPLVPGYMTGPMFTNGAWQFMTGGSYIFTDPVGQANANADYWFGGNCIPSPTSSYTYGSQTIKPTFEGSPPFSLGQNPIPLPANSFSQQWAVLDGVGKGEGSSAPSGAQMNASLKTASGTAYPTSGASSGVYLNYTTTSGVNTMAGGGFYVAGSASVSLSTSGSSAEVFGITQGSTTTSITVDPLATPPGSWNCPQGTVGTTAITSGSTTTNICSVPTNASVSPSQPGTILYVNGTVNSLSGPGQGLPGIQDYNAVTIVANGQINITGDLIYKTEPVTTTQNQIVPGTNPPCCNGSPAGALIPGHDNNQVVGIFTANGNINLSSSYSNNNLQVDGSLATLQQNSSYCFTVSGFINTFNNVGGQIQSGICGANMNTENTYFDRRFTSRHGFAPPWFPSTTITSAGATQATSTATVQRVQWVNNTTLQ